MAAIGLLGGCNTTTDSDARPGIVGTLGNGQLDIPGGALIGEIAGVVADVGIPLYLRSNPAALPAIEAVIAGLDTLYAGKIEITPQVIKSFTAGLAAQHGLQPGDEAFIGGLLFRAYKVYRAHVPNGPIRIDSPEARAFLDALRSQLADGVAFYRAFYAADYEAARQL